MKRTSYESLSMMLSDLLKGQLNRCKLEEGNTLAAKSKSKTHADMLYHELASEPKVMRQKRQEDVMI